MDDSAFKFSDLLRRVGNLVRRGHITAVSTDNARVRVALADVETDWLPWLTLRAGNDRTWWAPGEGEQVLVLSESGDFNNGTVLFGLYQSEHPAPNDDGDVSLIKYEDGATVSYDKGAHTLEVELPASGEFVIRIGRTSLSLRDAGVTLTAPTFAGVKS